MRILMVCLGNICRSPIAEGILNMMAAQQQLQWHIESAGTEAYHVGEPPHLYSQKICQKNGVDISDQRARRFERADFERFDKIYVMAADVMNEIRHMSGSQFNSEKATMFLNELYPGENRNVPDPWYGEEEGYAAVYDLIEHACAAIVRKYKGVYPPLRS